MNELTKVSEKRFFQTPKYDIFHNDGVYEVVVYMPSVVKEGVEVSLHNSLLTIEGKRGFKPKEDWRVIHQELPRDDYRLQLQLNIAIAKDAIKAKVKDGVLVLTLPVAESAKCRAIAID